MYGYIYLTTNLINDKKYIGQHKTNLDTIDLNYLGSGIALREAISKYGKENFQSEILVWVETKEEADIQEKYYISLYDAVNKDEFYNISEGGNLSGHPTGIPTWNKGLTADTDARVKANVEKMQQTKLLQHRPSWAKGLTKDTDERVARFSHTLSDESKDKIRKRLKGKSSKLKGRHLSEDVKLKISLSKKGVPKSEEHKQKLSKMVLCVETNTIYKSMKDASESVGLKNSTTIGLAVKDKCKTAAGFHWKLIEK